MTAMGWIKVTAAVVSGIIVVLSLAAWRAASHWTSVTSRAVQCMTRHVPENTAVVDLAKLDSLPKPVAKYFATVLTDGQAVVKTSRITQAGSLRLKNDDDAWCPFQASQHFRVRRPGFVWDAHVRMNAAMSARIRDAYVSGAAGMEVRINSLVSVADMHDRPELNEAALQRYLAEAVWFPTALLPDQGVRWSYVDESTALATLVDGDTKARLLFSFGKDGLITRVYSPGRYREVEGQFVRTPWGGNFSDYEERGGMLVPLKAVVWWRLKEETFTWWRGSIVEVAYDPGESPMTSLSKAATE